MILDQARRDIISIFQKAGVKASPADIVFPPDAKMGDLSFPVFAIAKDKSMAPGKLAQEVHAKLKPRGLVVEIKAAGPYMNFVLDREKVAKEIITPSQSPP